MVNLFGKGFIGSNYCEMYPCIVNERNDTVPNSNEILYLISTTVNHNIYTNPFIDIETNLIHLIKVLENCRNMKFVEPITFNFISSWFVYGDVNHTVDENSFCDPKGFYSITKRTAEQLLISYCETFKINYRIMRLCNVLGPGDKVTNKKNSLTYVLRKIKNNEDIDLAENGLFYRDYMHVKDICSAINLIINNSELNQIYNIGTGVSTCFRDVIEYLITKTNSKSQIKSYNQEIYAKYFSMKCDKLKQLGFIPKYEIKAIVDELLLEQSNQ